MFINVDRLLNLMINDQLPCLKVSNDKHLGTEGIFT
uniref:Uncharacterized protein n=1 Tax=Setaria italica TaxID=4555 RepID=K3YZL5_SETIT